MSRARIAWGCLFILAGMGLALGLGMLIALALLLYERMPT